MNVKKHTLCLGMLLSVACSVSTGFPSGVEFTCFSSGDCPAGAVCTEGVCSEPGDTELPSLDSAAAQSETSVVLRFSEALSSEGVDTLSNYALTPTLGVSSAALSEDRVRVTLTTEAQQPGTVYEIRTSELRDLAGNAVDTDTGVADFVGFGIVPDETPPTPILPLDGAVLTDRLVQFAWATRVGATTYTVELCDDAMCTSPQGVGSTDAPSTSLETLLPADGAYFWRVRADTTGPLINLTAQFDVVTEAVHVYCPPGVDCLASGARETGTAENPYRTIQRGVVAAQDAQIPVLRLAARGAGEAYLEPVFVAERPVSLLGGYDSTFSESTRDVVQNRTKIQYAGNTLLVARQPPGVPLVFEGLDLTAEALGVTSGIIIDRVGEDVTFRDIRIEAMSVGPGGSAIFLRNTEQGGPLLERLTVIGATAISGSGYALRDSVLVAEITGASLQSGDATLERNLIYGGVNGVYQGATDGDASISNCVIVAGSPSETTEVNGLYGRGLLAHHNTIVTLGGTPEYLLKLNGRVEAANNLFFSDSGMAFGVGSTPAEPPLSFINNALLNVLAETEDLCGVTGDLADLDGVSTPAGTSRVLGNIVDVATLAGLFTDHDGVDNDVLTLEDNDFSLLAGPLNLGTAGVDTTTFACGSVEAPAMCGPVPDDLLGAPRTVPVSIGAVEAP